MTPMDSNSFTADTFFILDFDRCIGNTDKFHTILEEVIERETTVSKQQLATAKIDAETRGETFDTIRYVKKALAETGGSMSWQPIERQFIAQAQKLNMLQPYARQLFHILESEHIPFGILTYGNEAWQLAKLEAANILHIPHLVTGIEGKGAILTGWKKSGGFIVPPALTKDFTALHANEIVFLDDKAVSFKGIPEGVRGVRVEPADGGELLPIQKGELPLGVTNVKGIYGAIELLFPQYADTIIDKT
jgi:hypothetical protein